MTKDMTDSLKMMSTSAGVVVLSWWTYLPDVVRFLILVANLVYITMKIWSEFSKNK